MAKSYTVGRVEPAPSSTRDGINATISLHMNRLWQAQLRDGVEGWIADLELDALIGHRLPVEAVQNLKRCVPHLAARLDAVTARVTHAPA